MINFYIGQSVVCINDGDLPGLARPYAPGELNGLTKGAVYTIRSFGTSPYFQIPGMRLEEIVRQHGDSVYALTRFRPLITRKTSIEVFEQLLTSTPQTQKKPTPVGVG